MNGPELSDENRTGRVKHCRDSAVYLTMNVNTLKIASEIVLTHTNQPGVTITVQTLENGVAHAFDSREDEGWWIGGREAAKDFVARWRRGGWR